MGTPICFQFLNPISATQQLSCNGIISFTLSGGYPEFHGGNFTVSNTGSGTLSGTSITNGGTLTINGLTNGQNYSFSVSSGGCFKNFSGTYSSSLSASISPSTATVASGNCVTITGNTISSSSNITSNNPTNYNIPDFGVGSGNNTPLVNTGSWITSAILISGACPATYSSGQFMSVCMNITHSWEPDVNIWLQSPAGTFIRLTNNNGDGSDFSMVVYLNNKILASDCSFAKNSTCKV